MLRCMQTLLLIRHAKAKNRLDWDEPDHLRPLTKKGRRQAEAIAAFLAEFTLDSLRSSPAVRCVDTIRPAAVELGVKLVIDEALMEGGRLPLPSKPGVHALCAHGDNIPAALRAMGLNGEPCRKGSIWIIERDATREIVRAEYLRPDM